MQCRKGTQPVIFLMWVFAAELETPANLTSLSEVQVAWVGANAANGKYGGWRTFLPVVAIVYVGVVLSDLITFGIGVLLRLGFLKRLRKSLLG